MTAETDCTVLFEDRWICVVNKPPGIFVHKSALDRRVPDCRSALELALGKKVYNVHRIDRPASGVVVYCLDRESAADVASQFRERIVEKKYLAIVRGHVEESFESREALPVGRHGPGREAVSKIKPLNMSVVNEPAGKYAEAWFSLVEAQIETGRPHQIRRHLRRATHPVIGDTEYGDTAQNRFAEKKAGFRRLALLAYSLALRHPESKKLMRFCSGIPPWWSEYLAALKLVLPPGYSRHSYADKADDPAQPPLPQQNDPELPEM